MRALVCLDPGPLATIQDRGRFGLQRFGVTPAGPMDRLGFEAAVALAGGTDHAIELTLMGGVWTVEGGPVRIAVAPAVSVRHGAQPIAPLTTVTLQPGERLTISGLPVRGYLAVEGGFDIAPVLGSRAQHLRSKLGWPGRALAAGDRLPLAGPPPHPGERCLPPDAAALHDGAIRVVLGPQDDHFTAAGIATLLSATFQVTVEADRMGYRLDGPAVEHAGDYNLVSDGITIGSIQVPGNGRPIILLADRQSTGGYPKIATVIGPDLGLLARKKPGDPVRFRAISLADAEGEAQRFATRLARLADAVGPAGDSWDRSSERLLALSLIDGVVSASR
ncbi:MAG: biotin-dependent carboxyltransferase [Alphaproteobacteria bacterium]|nr:biotin-dependent carboxyltransferase family protein [Alphaproteobacteria bacterium]TAD88558.1 MAG: biotin-dependent carboxyltransferase [Alphaproteobacteria bacterium]